VRDAGWPQAAGRFAHTAGRLVGLGSDRVGRAPAAATDTATHSAAPIVSAKAPREGLVAGDGPVAVEDARIEAL